MYGARCDKISICITTKMQSKQSSYQEGSSNQLTECGTYGMGTSHQQTDYGHISGMSSLHQQTEYGRSYGMSSSHQQTEYGRLYGMGTSHQKTKIENNSEEFSTTSFETQDDVHLARHEIDQLSDPLAKKISGRLLSRNEFSTLIFETLEKHSNKQMQSELNNSRSNSPSHNTSQINRLLDNAIVYDIDSTQSQHSGSQLGTPYDVPSPPSTPSSIGTSQVLRGMRVDGKFLEMGSFHLSDDELKPIFKNGRFCYGFNDQFIRKLNKFEDLSCVLISNGPYRSLNQTLWTFRYFCKHDGCERFYKVYQMTSNLFRVYRNFTNIVNDPENPICRPMKGEKRNGIKGKMKKLFPDKYLQECEKQADKKLLANGNLQDMISAAAAKVIRYEALAENDFHRDEIIDLLLMMLSEDENELQKNSNKDPDKEYGIESISYIQRICLQPFIVTLFTDDQFEIYNFLF